MHIIIIGAGLAGLSTYLHLRKHIPAPSLSITIIESHSKASAQNDTPSTYSGGLGIAPNGMRVLRRLSPELHAEVCAAGFPTREFTFRTEGAWRIGRWPAESGKDGECMVMINRRMLWEALRRRVPDTDVREGVRAVGARADGTVVLEGGDTIKADLVVGADGLRSVARKGVAGEGQEGGKAEFQSLMNIGGSFPSSYMSELPAAGDSGVVMTFGSTGFFGYGPSTSTHNVNGEPLAGPVGIWWSTYPDAMISAERKTTQQPSDKRLTLGLHERHHSWADPTIQHILKDLLEQQAASIDRDEPWATLDLHTPTWIVRKLPNWTKGRVLLVGDAAHALPSTSGQGVSQALEDSAVIALLLARMVEQGDDVRVDDNTVDMIGKRYMQLRKARIDAILDEALHMQSKKRKQSTLGKLMMYAALWVMIKLGISKRLVGSAFDYDVEEMVEAGVAST